ncbi:MAG: glycosyltransferase family 39 protein [Patescibacteria group bacterium]
MMLVWQPVDKLLANFADDAFYYFKTASNIANGLGPTFDGENMTNGYHPLWMGVNTLIYYLIPDDKILPIRIVLGLSVLLFFATTLLIWKIISQWSADKWIQALAVFGYALNPWNSSIYFNGLETPLALFLLVSLFFIFSGILRKKENHLSDFFFLGAVMGLVILTKLDYGLFAAAIFFYFIWNWNRFLWKPLFVFVIPAALIAAPWFLYNYFYFGALIPASGLSYTLVNHRLWFYKERSLIYIILWSVYNFFGTVAFMLRTVGIPVFYSGYGLIRSFFSLSAVFAPIIFASLYFFIKKKDQWNNFWGEFFNSAEGRALVVFFTAFMGLVVVHGAIRWSGREWYFASFQFLIVIFLAVVLSRSALASYKKIIAAILGILLSISFYYSWVDFTSQKGNQSEMYQVAVWMKDNLPSNARIAAFNSGIHGYFSGHFVMNSDGMINNSAYEAMKNNSLWKLFEKENIDYIADYEITLTYRYKLFLGIDNVFERLQKIDLPAHIDRSGDYGGSHINIYKILK